MNPIHLDPYEYLYKELDDVNEIIFVEDGSVDCGYEINRKEKYVIRFFRSIFGMYECSFNRRCNYIYRANDPCDGYFVRRREWKQICEEFPLFNNIMKKRALEKQFNKIWKVIMKKKKQDIEYYRIRSDYKNIIALTDNNAENDMVQMIRNFEKEHQE